MEEWKLVPETNGKIYVSNEGRVKSFLGKNERILKQQKDKKGYMRLSVTISGVKRTYKVHRMVAQAFIPNYDGLPQVNHIDCNKTNNCVSNLEWVSNKQNVSHAIRNGLWSGVNEGVKKENEKRKKRVVATKDNAIMYFESISAAERHFGSRHIIDVLKGKRKTVKGWSFSYAERG